MVQDTRFKLVIDSLTARITSVLEEPDKKTIKEDMSPLVCKTALEAIAYVDPRVRNEAS